MRDFTDSELDLMFSKAPRLTGATRTNGAWTRQERL